MKELNLTPEQLAQLEIQQNRNRVFEYLQYFEGTASRIKRIFDYHYDSILREVYQELSSQFNDTPDSRLVMDFIIEHMEEIMNWPDSELTQEEFNKLIANIDQED